MHNEQWATEHIKATGAMMEKSPTTARMGPNSVIQTFNAVKARFGDSKAQELLRCAGLDKYSRELPCEMIDEQEFHRLVKSVCETFNEPVRSEILLDAGRRTAYYLLQTRIPKFFQWLLKRLPTRWAAKLLLRSIQRHSWTFAGSGTFDYQVGVAIEAVVVVKCVANDTVAYFYGGALHTLFQTLFKDKTDFKVKVAPSNDGLLCRYSAHIIACQP